MGGDDTDEEGYYDYYTETDGGEEDDQTTQGSIEHDSFLHSSLAFSASNDSERKDIDEQDLSFKPASSQVQTPIDQKMSGERQVPQDVGRIPFGRPTLQEVPHETRPLPYLHNYGLARVQSSHALILDESVLPMDDLDASIRSAYHTSAPCLAALLFPKY